MQWFHIGGPKDGVEDTPNIHYYFISNQTHNSQFDLVLSLLSAVLFNIYSRIASTLLSLYTKIENEEKNECCFVAIHSQTSLHSKLL